MSVIKLINKLYMKKAKIKIFTARYMGRNKDNEKLVRRNTIWKQKIFLKMGS